MSEHLDDLEALLGERPSGLRPIAGAANSRVLRAKLARGPVLVKVYFRHPDDPRDRLAAEAGLLRHLTRHGVDCVPAVIATDPARGLGVFEFVDGTPLTPSDVTSSDVSALAGLLGEHWRVSSADGAEALPHASEATFRERDLLALLEQRRAKLLDALTEAVPLAGEVRALLEGPLLERFERERARFTPAELDRELPTDARILSPSDHGFHNALRRPDGRLLFIDFEYGGWDDPAKMLADALLHPAVPLPPPHRAAFLKEALARLGDPPGLEERLAKVYPLYALKWVLILLNCFLPMVRARRAHAGTERSGADQLAQARAALAALPPLGADLADVLARG